MIIIRVYPIMDRARAVTDEHSLDFELIREDAGKSRILCRCTCDEHSRQPWIVWFSDQEASWRREIDTEEEQNAYMDALMRDLRDEYYDDYPESPIGDDYDDGYDYDCWD